MPLLESKNIRKTYHLESNAIEVLKGIDLTINNGEMVSIVGPSGAGKSTLLHILGALDRPTDGQLSIDGTDVFSRSETELAKFRNETIGFVFQFHHLLPEFTALENVMMPALIAQKSKRDIIPVAEELLRSVGMDHRLSHKPGELSGGEQQRVAIARALINKPKLILADEPSGNLDRTNAQSLHNLMCELSEQGDTAFIIVTHNDELAALSTRQIHLEDGKTVTQNAVLS